jgi:chemotaxis protein MotB
MMKTKNRRKKEDVAEAKWVVIYCSLSIILVSFFIMLLSYACFEKERIVPFRKSFLRAVNILPGGLLFEKGGEILSKTPPIEEIKIPTAMQKELEEYFAASGLKKGVKVSEEMRGMVLTFVDAVLFDTASARIKESAFPILRKIGSLILKNRFFVRIEGHTDSRLIHTREFPTNWELSVVRAVNILRYFLDKSAVPAERLSAVGYGQFQPAAENTISEGRAKNRRVEIIFTEG